MLSPPRRCKVVFRCIPFGMIVFPVAHELVYFSTVDTAYLPLSILNELAEKLGAWRERHVVDVAIERLVHSEHELSHSSSRCIAVVLGGATNIPFGKSTRSQHVAQRRVTQATDRIRSSRWQGSPFSLSRNLPFVGRLHRSGQMTRYPETGLTWIAPV